MHLCGGCGKTGFPHVFGLGVPHVFGLGVGSGESTFHVTLLFLLADIVVVDEAAAMAGIGEEAKVALSVL